MRSYRYACSICLVLLAAGLRAPAAPTEASALTPAQRLELETLRKQLSDPARSPQTKREAAVLLLNRPYPQALDVAKEFLQDASNRPAQIAVAEAIASSGRTSEEFVKPLLEMLTGKEPSVRAPAAAALVASKSEKVLEEFVRIASDAQGDPAVRLVVIEAMGRVLEKRAVDALIGLLDDRDRAIVDAACDTLTRLTSIRAFGREPARWKAWWAENRHKPQSDWLADLAESLARANRTLEKENDDVRKRLAEVMTELHNATPPAGRDAVLEQMLKDAVPEVRLAGAKLLQQRLPPNPALPDGLRDQVRARLTDTEPAVRKAAALLLANSSDPQAGDLLTARLQTEAASEVRQAVYQALGLLREVGAWDGLVGGVGKPDAGEAIAAAGALARVAEKQPPDDPARAKAVDALKARYLSAEAPEQAPVREALLGAMAVIGDKDLLGLMQSALKDKAATVRLGAVKAIQRLALANTAGLVAPLAGKDETDRGVRLAAVVAIGALGGPDDIETVLARTDAKVESDPAVRQQAWTVAKDLLAKADAAKLSALADKFAARDDAGDFLARLLRLWAQKIPNDKPQEWVPIRRRLAEALLASGQPTEAGAEFAAVHAALVQANSPDAPKVWLKWIEALLEGGDPAALGRIAESSDSGQVSAALALLFRRLDALKARKEWDGLVRLGEAALQRLPARLDESQRTTLEGLLREAQVQQAQADRQRVAGLVARLADPDESARAQAARDLAAMNARAVAPLVDELQALLGGAEDHPPAEKPILDALRAAAPSLTGYDPSAAKTERLKVVEQWKRLLTAAPTTTQAATRPGP